MAGPTGLEPAATVNKHYFNLDDETLQAIVEDWEAPDVDLFTPPEPSQSA